VDVKSVRRWSEHCTENPKTVVIARTPEYRNQAAIRRWSELPLECAVASIDGSLTDRYRAHGAQCDPSEMVQEITGLQDVISAINESRLLPSPTAEMDSLLAKAIQIRGTPENVSEWAARLAEDISNLTD